MAAKTDVAERIESGLYALTAEVEWLPNTIKEWDQVSDAERISISLDWDHLLYDYLPELDQFYRGGAMNIIQKARYRQLLWKIRDALPLFQRLGKCDIPVSLEL